MRTTFTMPEDWDTTQPLALPLPLGEAGDFSHPEALAYIEGIPYAACDRHHQEILLKPEWADGKPHLLRLLGVTRGAVTMMGLANDTEHRVELWIDAQI